MTFLICSCSQDNNLYRIQENGLYGFIDSTGAVIIEPQYKYVGHFNSGYACVVSDMKLIEKDGIFKKDSVLQVKYGYINRDNNLIIDTTNVIEIQLEKGMEAYPKKFVRKSFDFRTTILQDLDLRDDRYVFQDAKTKHYGYKDSEGNIVIEAKYAVAKPFCNGRATVIDTITEKQLQGKIDASTIYNRMGAIDKSGEMVVKPEFAFINPFGKDGETWACQIVNDNGAYTKEWTLIDNNGKVIIPPIGMDYVYNNPSDNIYTGQMNMLSLTCYTFIDKQGNFLTDDNHDGSLVLSLDGKGKSEMLEDVTGFSEGFAGVKGKYNGQPAWFIVNRELKSNNTPYDSLLRFSESLIAVEEYSYDRDIPQLKSGKWGYIDKNAKIIIPYQFSECGSFHGGIAYFKKWGASYDLEGYIDKGGKVVWQTKVKK